MFRKDLTSHELDDQPAKKAGYICIILLSPVILLGIFILEFVSGYILMGIALCILYVARGGRCVLRFVMERFKKTADVFWNLCIWIWEWIRRRKGGVSPASMPAEGHDVELAVFPESSLHTVSSLGSSEKTVVGGSVSLKNDGSSKPIVMSESRPKASRVWSLFTWISERVRRRKRGGSSTSTVASDEEMTVVTSGSLRTISSCKDGEESTVVSDDGHGKPASNLKKDKDSESDSFSTFSYEKPKF
ncbi:hypothetical protein CPC08DRAFT_820509 [Agrocybe pediades]|nr:hypothetical protein CPC08DRAFT_820509 [Agrocybe pediades]